jgi:hypothetical protein
MGAVVIEWRAIITTEADRVIATGAAPDCKRVVRLCKSANSHRKRGASATLIWMDGSRTRMCSWCRASCRITIRVAVPVLRRDRRTQTRHKSRNLHNAKIRERRLFCRRGTTFARVRFPNQVLRVRGALADLVFLHRSLGICLSLQITEHGRIRWRLCLILVSPALAGCNRQTSDQNELVFPHMVLPLSHRGTVALYWEASKKGLSLAFSDAHFSCTVAG